MDPKLEKLRDELAAMLAQNDRDVFIAMANHIGSGELGLPADPETRKLISTPTVLWTLDLAIALFNFEEGVIEVLRSKAQTN